jgi:hypothetical protein
MTWRATIARARRRRVPLFTLAEINRAGHWATCAVGEQAHRHPGTVVMLVVGLGIPMPDDLRLRRLGGMFSRHVQNWRIDEAAATLDKIERRVLTMKRGPRDA